MIFIRLYVGEDIMSTDNNITQNQFSDNKTEKSAQEKGSERLKVLVDLCYTADKSIHYSTDTLTKLSEKLLFFKEGHTEIDTLSILPNFNDQHLKGLYTKAYKEQKERFYTYILEYITETEKDIDDKKRDIKNDSHLESAIFRAKNLLEELEKLVPEAESCREIYGEKNTKFSVEEHKIHLNHRSALSRHKTDIENFIRDTEQKKKGDEKLPPLESVDIKNTETYHHNENKQQFFKHNLTQDEILAIQATLVIVMFIVGAIFKAKNPDTTTPPVVATQSVSTGIVINNINNIETTNKTTNVDVETPKTEAKTDDTKEVAKVEAKI